MKYQQAYYSLVDRAVQCTLITTCQYFGHWRHLSVAEFCEGVQVGGCEGMIPHVCVHCRAIEKWPFWIPGSNNARLMDERKKQQQCKKNTITQDSETPPCGQLGMSASSKKKKFNQAACIFLTYKYHHSTKLYRKKCITSLLMLVFYRKNFRVSLHVQMQCT